MIMPVPSTFNGCPQQYPILKAIPPNATTKANQTSFPVIIELPRVSLRDRGLREYQPAPTVYHVCRVHPRINAAMSGMYLHRNNPALSTANDSVRPERRRRGTHRSGVPEPGREMDRCDRRGWTGVVGRRGLQLRRGLER